MRALFFILAFSLLVSVWQSPTDGHALHVFGTQARRVASVAGRETFAPARTGAALHAEHILTAQSGSPITGPTGLVASVSGNTVGLQWVAGALPVSSYVVEVDYWNGFFNPISAIFDTGNAATSLVVSDVPAKVYWVRVRARHGSETSAPSNVVRVIVSTGPCFDMLLPPYGWTAAGQGSSVTLTLPTRGGCPPTDYIIEARYGPNEADWAQYRLGSSASAIVVSGVPTGTHYVRLRSAHGSTLSGPAEERIVVVGSNPCVYSVSPPLLSISNNTIPSNVSIAADAECLWTVFTNWASPLQTAGGFPRHGLGTETFQVGTFPWVGLPRSGTLEIRWSGGGVDLSWKQTGRIPIPPLP